MRHTAGVFLVAFIGALPALALSDAAPSTPDQIVAHHMSAIASADLDEVMGDFADNAVVISPAGVTKGKAAIRKMFSRLVAGPPGSRPHFDIKQTLFTGDIVYLAWLQNEGKPNEVRGFETYVVRRGKIVVETVATVNMHPTPGQ